MDSFEPHNSLSRPRGWPATSKGNRGHQGVLPTGVPRHICTPVTSWVVKEEVSTALAPPVSDLPVPPATSSSLSVPNLALSTAGSLPGPPPPPPTPFPATTACLFPFRSQASRKACLHLLSSFLTSNFLFNPLLPDLFCSVERPYLR